MVNDFIALLLTQMELPQKDRDSNFHVGSFEVGTVGEAIIPAMESWVRIIDRKLDKAERFSKTYIQLMEQRVCTLEEYQLLFSEKIKEDLFPAFRVFEYFMIENEQQRGFYIATRTPDVETYIQEIQQSKSKVRLFFSQKVVARIPKEEIKRHLYCVAKSGSGKTELLKTIFYDLQKSSQEKRQLSQVLLEPHGDFCEEVLRFHLNADKGEKGNSKRENNSNKERIVYLNPYLDKKQSRVPIINPLDMLPMSSNQDVDTLSQQIVNAFEELSDDTSFTDRMRGLLRACISVLLLRPNSTFLDLLDFMQNRSDLIELGKQSENVVYRRLFSHAFTSGEYENTKKAVYSKVYTLLSTSGFANVVLGKSTINLQEAVDSGKIVIVNLSKGDLGDDASKALGCFVMALLRAITFKRASVPKHLRKPTYLFIDEAQNYVSKSMEVILSESRKYGLHLLISHQFNSQIENRKLKESLLTNSAVKLVGETNDSSFSTMSKEMYIEVDKLKAMKKYHFAVKVGHRDAFVMKTPDHLLFNASKPSSFYMNDSTFKDFKSWMLLESGYYQPREKNFDQQVRDLEEPQAYDLGEESGFTSTQAAPKPKFTL